MKNWLKNLLNVRPKTTTRRKKSARKQNKNDSCIAFCVTWKHEHEHERDFQKKNVWQIIFSKTARKFMKDEPLTILFCSDTLSIFCKYITNPANGITFKIRNKRQKDYS